MDAKTSTFSIALILFLLIGCSAKEPEIRYVEKPVYVEIPVATKIEIERIKKPDYNFLRKLKYDSTPQEIAEAYANTIKRMNSYIKQLEYAIEPFYKKEIK